MSPARIISAVLLAGTAVTAGLALSGVDSPVRPVVTVGFFLLAPGWAVTAVFSPPRRTAPSSARWALAVALSAGIDALAGEAMLLTGWYPLVAFGALLVVTAVLLGWHLALGVRRERSDEAT